MYKAILFAPDGDFVTDFKNEIIDDVWKDINNMGSKWVFYPFCFVMKNKRIVDCPRGFDFLKRKSVKTVQEFFILNDSVM